MKSVGDVIIILDRVGEVEKDGKKYMLWSGNDGKHYITTREYVLAHYGYFVELAIGYSDTEIAEIANLNDDHTDWDVVEIDPKAYFRLYDMEYDWFNKHVNILRKAQLGEDGTMSSKISAIFHYIYEQVHKDKLDIPESNIDYLVKAVVGNVFWIYREIQDFYDETDCMIVRDY